MMKLLQDAQGGQGLAELAAQFGLDRSQAESLAGLLAPAIGSAMKKKAEAGDLARVAEPLLGERQAAYFDEPARAADPEARAEGAQFLDLILGSSDARETLASEAANRSGFDMGTVAQFLPALAAMLQGGMQKRMPDDALQGMMGGGAQPGIASGGGAGALMGIVSGLLGGNRDQGGPAGRSGDISGLLAMLDADGDGSPLDDILERFMR